MDVLIDISGIHTNKLISLHQLELVGLFNPNSMPPTPEKKAAILF